MQELHEQIIFAAMTSGLTHKIKAVLPALEAQVDALVNADRINLTAGAVMYNAAGMQEQAISADAAQKRLESIKALAGLSYNTHDVGCLTLNDLIHITRIVSEGRI